jgi:hypothetical protein
MPGVLRAHWPLTDREWSWLGAWPSHELSGDPLHLLRFCLFPLARNDERLCIFVVSADDHSTTEASDGISLSPATDGRPSPSAGESPEDLTVPEKSPESLVIPEKSPKDGSSSVDQSIEEDDDGAPALTESELIFHDLLRFVPIVLQDCDVVAVSVNAPTALLQLFIDRQWQPVEDVIDPVLTSILDQLNTPVVGATETSSLSIPALSERFSEESACILPSVGSEDSDHDIFMSVQSLSSLIHPTDTSVPEWPRSFPVRSKATLSEQRVDYFESTLPCIQLSNMSTPFLLFVSGSDEEQESGGFWSFFSSRTPRRRYHNRSHTPESPFQSGVHWKKTRKAYATGAAPSRGHGRPHRGGRGRGRGRGGRGGRGRGGRFYRDRRPRSILHTRRGRWWMFMAALSLASVGTWWWQRLKAHSWSLTWNGLFQSVRRST